jgi:hypothetical protein
MAKKQVLPGNPPLMWGDIKDAFESINSNFDEIYATISTDSTGPIDFEQLYTSVNPANTDQYYLGTETHRWAQLHIGESLEDTPTYYNGIWIAGAHIRGEAGVIDLPIGSTVNGDLIIDPNKTFFKEVQVDNDQVVVASDFLDSLNLISGTAMRLTVDSSAESITIDNIGVTRLTGSTGISVSAATGNITLTNSGVTSVANSAALPDPGLTVGVGIAANTSTGAVTLTNTGVIDVDAGFGITISRDDASGIVTVTNSAPAQVAFRTFFVEGSNPATDTIVADSTSDTFTFADGYGITMTTDPATDKLTISVDQDIDINGSVFAKDSGIMVNTIDNTITATGGITGDLTGNVTGNVTGDLTGNVTGNISGDIVGNVAGDLTGSVFADDSTMMIDGSNGKVVGDVQTDDIIVNGATGKITFDSLTAPEITNGDSSVRMVMFGDDYSPGTAQLYVEANNVWLYSDVTVEQALLVKGGITGDLKGSVFADDSTTIVDSVNSTLTANSVTVNSVYADELIGIDGSGDLTIKGGNSSGNGGIVTLYGGETIGASPNIDGYVEVTGPGFRVAVTNIPGDSTGQEGDKAGMIAVDSTSMYYCIADWASPGTADIWVKQDWSTTGAW